MDLLMPDMDGVEATRQIKRLSPRTQVVVLTSHHDELKSVRMDELAEAVRRAAQGDATLHPRVAARVIHELQGTQHQRDTPNPFAELTNRELEILKLIAQGMNNHEIMTHLVISEHTVKGHVSNILSKLHLADRTQAAIYAWREGIVRRE
jgi:NarL family two-component system response regulator LiaR